jgi:Helix-turn-helix of DDE superfamily endonuclease
MRVFDGYSSKPPEVFQRMVGISLGTFMLLLEKVRVAFATYENEQPTRKRGRRNSMALEDQLLLNLLYMRSYGTFLNLGFQFGTSESNAYKRYVFIRTLLLRCLDMPDESSLRHAIKGEYVAIDVTEQAIERPVENQKEYYSGKKTAHGQDSANCVPFDQLNTWNTVQ